MAATVATSFKVYRSSDNVNFSWFVSTGQGVTSYTWTGGSPATSYYFYVTAYNRAGESAPSNTAAVTTPAPAAAPSSLAATTVSGTGLPLYRSTDAVSWVWFALTVDTPAEEVLNLLGERSNGVRQHGLNRILMGAADSADGVRDLVERLL